MVGQKCSDVPGFGEGVVLGVSSTSFCLCPSSLHPLSRLQAACHRLKLWPELQDLGGDYVSAALGSLTTLLEQGLGSRLHLLAHSRPPVLEVRCCAVGSLWV